METGVSVHCLLMFMHKGKGGMFIQAENEIVVNLSLQSEEFRSADLGHLKGIFYRLYLLIQSNQENIPLCVCGTKTIFTLAISCTCHISPVTLTFSQNQKSPLTLLYLGTFSLSPLLILPTMPVSFSFISILNR